MVTISKHNATEVLDFIKSEFSEPPRSALFNALSDIAESYTKLYELRGIFYNETLIIDGKPKRYLAAGDRVYIANTQLASGTSNGVIVKCEGTLGDSYFKISCKCDNGMEGVVILT